MSIWSRISDALAALAAGEPLSTVFEKLATPPERSVGFAIAVIALGAKMAKADGIVNRADVMAFRDVFHIAKADEAQAARVFDLARQDAAGFETYAQQIKKMFGNDMELLEDLFAGLFHIAIADGGYHPLEDMFLGRVAQIFGISERSFRSTRARFVPTADRDPYDVLGISPNAPMDQVRAAWRSAVRASHPDQFIARGLPQEAIKLAETRMTAINKAWEEIRETRAA